MSYSCPTCYNLQVLDEEDNVYDLICTNCGSVFCAKCGNESHYPALCDDFRKWNNPDLISPNDDLNCFHAMNSIKCCKETTWKYYDEVLNFLKEKESGLSPSDLYNVKGGVNYAFDELRGVISYLKWVHVHLCFNDEPAEIVSAVDETTEGALVVDEEAPAVDEPVERVSESEEAAAVNETDERVPVVDEGAPAVDEMNEGAPARGACGYGELGRDINDGEVSGVSSRLWKNGAGCGACYQVRCKIPPHCNEEGVYVVATDYGEGDGTDFIFSPKAYGSMARPGTEFQLYSFGVVDVEYQRVPCRYGGYNLVYKIHEKSYNPPYLAILILYVGGVNDILAVEVWQEDCKEWKRMRRAFGAVHDYQNPPRGTLSLRFLVYGSAGLNWVESQNALPADWTAGATYNSNILLS
ncbi:hypothetical protein Bca4012_079807 [Brassica carinata]